MSRAHLLSLKVLRTSPASLATTTTSESEPSSTLTLPNSFGTIYQGERFTGLLSLRIDRQQQLTAKPVLNPKLLVEIQSPNLPSSDQKAHIASISAPQLISPSALPHSDPSAQHQEALELVIDHQIVDLGLHSLICTVTYQEPPSSHDGADQEEQAQIRSFRKLYKFQVLNPVALKTKIYRYEEEGPGVKEQKKALLESLKKAIEETDGMKSEIEDAMTWSKMVGGQEGEGSYYCEVQVQNQSSKAMLDLGLKLSAASGRGTSIEAMESLTGGAEPLTQIMPGDIRQYAFKVLDKSTRGGGASRPVPDLELELSWRSFMGERGRMVRTLSSQTPDAVPSESPRPSSPAGMLAFESLGHSRRAAGQPGAAATDALFELELVSLPASRRVAVGRPFQITFRLSLCGAAIGGGGGEQAATMAERLTRILHTRLASLRLHDLPPALILLTPQPLQPSRTHPTSREFSLHFLLTHPPLIPPLLYPGRLSTSLPHLDLLFGFPQNPNPFGPLFVHLPDP